MNAPPRSANKSTGGRSYIPSDGKGGATSTAGTLRISIVVTILGNLSVITGKYWFPFFVWMSSPILSLLTDSGGAVAETVEVAQRSSVT